MGAGWGLVWRGFCVGAGGVLSGWVLLWQGFLGGGFFYVGGWFLCGNNMANW